MSIATHLCMKLKKWWRKLIFNKISTEFGFYAHSSYRIYFLISFSSLILSYFHHIFTHLATLPPPIRSAFLLQKHRMKPRKERKIYFIFIFTYFKWFLAFNIIDLLQWICFCTFILFQLTGKTVFRFSTFVSLLASILSLPLAANKPYWNGIEVFRTQIIFPL